SPPDWVPKPKSKLKPSPAEDSFLASAVAGCAAGAGEGADEAVGVSEEAGLGSNRVTFAGFVAIEGMPTSGAALAGAALAAGVGMGAGDAGAGLRCAWCTSQFESGSGVMTGVTEG